MKLLKHPRWYVRILVPIGLIVLWLVGAVVLPFSAALPFTVVCIILAGMSLPFVILGDK